MLVGQVMDWFNHWQLRYSILAPLASFTSSPLLLSSRNFPTLFILSSPARFFLFFSPNRFELNGRTSSAVRTYVATQLRYYDHANHANHPLRRKNRLFG